MFFAWGNNFNLLVVLQTQNEIEEMENIGNISHVTISSLLALLSSIRILRSYSQIVLSDFAKGDDNRKSSSDWKFRIQMVCFPGREWRKSDRALLYLLASK